MQRARELMSQSTCSHFSNTISLLAWCAGTLSFHFLVVLSSVVSIGALTMRSQVVAQHTNFGFNLSDENPSINFPSFTTLPGISGTNVT
jgi:hypothetical protein